jgi:virulence factor Mce-like protein
MRRGTASIVASPVLVGAITVLIVVVSVFLAYNANQGLPFVPTYDLKAELPSGANLVEGNEVRLGGFRVGVLDQITARTIEEGGETRSIAVIDMSLDKTVEPLATDTQVIVRPRSALGLKYVELTPGTADTDFQPGDTIPLAQAGDPVEFDDLLNTFDQGLRDDSRTALTGFGDAFAGRGQSLNVALAELPRFFTGLTNVMDVLSDEDTELDEFFVQIGRATAQVAPVAGVQAELFTNMADTFEAVSRNPEALVQTIEGAPATLQAGIESFPVQRPFLADFADLSRRLGPAARELPRSLPAVNSALVAGQEVLPRTTRYNRRTGEVLAAVDTLAENPNTLLGLQDLDTTGHVTGPLIQHVGPYQTVCNYLTYFFNPLSEHIAEVVPGGTIERVLLRLDPGLESGQHNRFGAYTPANRPADIPIDVNPKSEHGKEFYAYHNTAFRPAIDAQGRADCQNAQEGFLVGPLNPPVPRYPPAVFDNSSLPPNSGPSALDRGGGSSTVTASDIPYVFNGGRAGPTFDPNSPDGLGVERLKDVP